MGERSEKADPLAVFDDLQPADAEPLDRFADLAAPDVEPASDPFADLAPPDAELAGGAPPDVFTDLEPPEDDAPDVLVEPDATAAIPVARPVGRTMWIAAAVATALAGGLGLIRYPYFVREPCRLLPVARADVRVGTSGFVAEVLAREGDVVEKHQVIARLRDDVLDAERSKVETEIRAMEARLEKALRGARPEEIDAARALMSTKAKAVEFAQRELGRQRNLFANGVGARAALDAAEKDVASAAAELREVRAEWALLSSALREEQIQIARVELERAKAQQAYLDARVERLVVRSPVKGTLVTPRFEESVDRRVAPGDVLCRVVDATKLEAELEIGEHDRDAVRTGLPAAVKIQSFPDRVFTGRVDFVAPSIESRGNLRYFRAVVTIDNEDGVLTDRMSGYAEIDTGSRPLIVLLLRRWLRRALVAWLI